MRAFMMFRPAMLRPLIITALLAAAASVATAQVTKTPPDTTKKGTKTVTPPATKTTPPSTGTKTTTAPATGTGTTTAPSTGTKTTTAPAGGTKAPTVPPTGTKTVTPPPTGTKTVAPTTTGTKTPTQQPAGTKTATGAKALPAPPLPKAAAPTDTKTAAPSTGQTKVNPPAGQTKTNPPVGQVKTNPPVGQVKTNPPAGQAKTNPPPQTGRGAQAGRGATPSGLNVVRSDTAAVQPLVMMREVFSYEGAGRRDPFLSLLTTDDLRPTISDLKLLMTVVDEPGRSVALLSDAYDKKQHSVRVGTRLGRMRVTSIRSNAVFFSIEEFGMNRRDSLLLRVDSTKVRVP